MSILFIKLIGSLLLGYCFFTLSDPLVELGGGAGSEGALSANRKRVLLLYWAFLKGHKTKFYELFARQKVTKNFYNIKIL